jgi:hypothetical protein
MQGEEDERYEDMVVFPGETDQEAAKVTVVYSHVKLTIGVPYDVFLEWNVSCANRIFVQPLCK